MALLRSDIVNKDLIEKVIKQKEGTSRVSLSSITVNTNSNNEIRTSLLIENLGICAAAKVKGDEKEYHWFAKVIQSDINTEPRNHELIKREINFYDELIPKIYSLINPTLLKLDSFIWSQANDDVISKEILIFETDDDFSTNIDGDFDLSHVIHGVSWLAKLHGLSYVLLKKDPKIMEKFPNIDDTPVEKVGIKTKLVKMVMTSLQEEIAKDKVVANPLMSRQDWLFNLKSMIETKRAKRNPKAFKSLIHGEPWFGNVKFSYREDSNGKIHVNDSLFQDFHNCSVGSPGDDLAIFIMSSTNRKFREKYLDIVLGSYLKELKDMINSQGFDDGVYDFDELKEDYKCGLMVGLSFSLFCVPILTKSEDQTDINNDALDEIDGDKLIKIHEKTKDGLVDVLEYLEIH